MRTSKDLLIDRGLDIKRLTQESPFLNSDRSGASPLVKPRHTCSHESQTRRIEEKERKLKDYELFLRSSEQKLRLEKKKSFEKLEDVAETLRIREKSLDIEKIKVTEAQKILNQEIKAIERIKKTIKLKESNISPKKRPSLYSTLVKSSQDYLKESLDSETSVIVETTEPNSEIFNTNPSFNSSSKLTTLRNQLYETKEKLKSAESQIRQLEQINEKNKKILIEVENLRIENQQLKNYIEKSQETSSISDFDPKFENLQRENEKLKQNKSKKLKILNEELQSLKVNFENTLSELSTTKSELKSTKLALSSAKIDNTKKHLENSNEHSAIKVQLNSALSQIKVMKSIIDIKDKELEETKNHLANTKSDIEYIKIQLDHSRVEISSKQSDIDELKIENTVMKNEIDSGKKKINTMKQEIGKLENELCEIGERGGKMDVLDREREKIKMKELFDENQNLKDKILVAYEEKKLLFEEKGKVHKELEVYVKNTQKLEEYLNDITNQKNQLEKELKNHIDHSNEIQDKSKDAKIMAYKQKILSKEIEVNDLKKQIKEFIAQIEKDSDEIISLSEEKKKYDVLKLRYEKKFKECEDIQKELESNLSNMIITISPLIGEAAIQQYTFSEVKKKDEEINNLQISLDKAYDDLSKASASFNQTILASKLSESSLKAEINCLKSELDFIKSQLNYAGAEFSIIITPLITNEETNNRRFSSLKSGEKIVELEKELESARDEVYNARNELMSCQAELFKANSELIRTKSDLEMAILLTDSYKVHPDNRQNKEILELRTSLDALKTHNSILKMKINGLENYIAREGVRYRQEIEKSLQLQEKREKENLQLMIQLESSIRSERYNNIKEKNQIEIEDIIYNNENDLIEENIRLRKSLKKCELEKEELANNIERTKNQAEMYRKLSEGLHTQLNCGSSESSDISDSD
ncbi:hypothetical protein SteCoe_16512 [Stentor coeruleus]|uniref:Uncharacterized protein n=1 Tax=Stentor coeruleus TaxID=5963 RepID=A0A1R2C131_9CILI|nr:hypothetical protein SteCoe_16512 [Stentor coeruleus]